MLTMTTLASLCLATTVADAQTPGPVMPYNGAQEIYDNAVDMLQTTVSRCRTNNRETTAEAVRLIHFLVSIGQDDLAEVVAKYFAEEIVDFSGACADYATRNCRRAIDTLRLLDAPELARALQRHCKRALLAIEESEEGSLQRIRAALP
jgi:hypothetical protein